MMRVNWTLLMTFELYKYIESLAVQGTHHFLFVKFSGIIGVKLRLYSENKMKKRLIITFLL